MHGCMHAHAHKRKCGKWLGVSQMQTYFLASFSYSSVHEIATGLECLFNAIWTPWNMLFSMEYMFHFRKQSKHYFEYDNDKMRHCSSMHWWCHHSAVTSYIHNNKL